MAIVYSYPIASPEAQDLLVGTEMALQGGEDAPRTRTFTIGSIVDLVTPALNLKANLASPTFTGTLTTVNDAVINGVKVGRGVGNFVSNVIVGNTTLNSNTSGSYNSALGNNSLSNNLDGSYNSAFGSSSLASNTSGTDNVAIGINTLINNSTGSYNTAVGGVAGTSITTESNSTCLGYNAQVLGSNEIQLGNSTTTPYAYQALSLRSDLRDKTEVRDTVLGLDFINELRPVDYKWDIREDYRGEIPTQGELSDEDFKILMDEWLESCKLDNLTHDGTHTRTRYHHGLIAQEVKDVIEASGADFGGFQDHSVNGGQDVLSIGYTELIAPMIKAIQELKAEIELLKSK